jgi:hypothetical protein
LHIANLAREIEHDQDSISNLGARSTHDLTNKQMEINPENGMMMIQPELTQLKILDNPFDYFSEENPYL